MPFIYNLQSKAQGENLTTSGSANTELDHWFIKPGASRAVAIIALRLQGKGAGLTALSGIAVRIKQFTTAASTAGTAVTPAPVDKRAPAAVATHDQGTGGGTAVVTAGSGGPNLVGGAGMGASGPGGWVAPNADGAIVLDGGANMSDDFFSSCPTASLSFEMQAEIQE
jgi:hypothetical protein